MVSEVPASLEWSSVLNVIQIDSVRSVLPALDQAGIIAYTDGACIKNPGGPAGWSALLWAAVDFVDGSVREEAACLECYGHIPRAQTTTNNRAEIAAVLAVLSLAPTVLPLTIYSDSEYTIKVAMGTYQMKANPDLWQVYRKLLGYRRQPPTFIWVRGHAGHLHNERADELAGLGAWNSDHAAYAKWQASNAPEAHNAPASPEREAMRQNVQKLKDFFDSRDSDTSRVSSTERDFIRDMAKRLRKNDFTPSEKQANWIKGLTAKYRV